MYKTCRPTLSCRLHAHQSHSADCMQTTPNLQTACRDYSHPAGCMHNNPILPGCTQTNPIQHTACSPNLQAACRPIPSCMPACIAIRPAGRMQTNIILQAARRPVQTCRHACRLIPSCRLHKETYPILQTAWIAILSAIV